MICKCEDSWGHFLVLQHSNSAQNILEGRQICTIHSVLTVLPEHICERTCFTTWNRLLPLSLIKISKGGYQCCVILDTFSCGLWGEFFSIQCQTYHYQIRANRELFKKQDVFPCLAIVSINKKKVFWVWLFKAVNLLDMYSGFFHWVPEEVQQQSIIWFWEPHLIPVGLQKWLSYVLWGVTDLTLTWLLPSFQAH